MTEPDPLIHIDSVVIPDSHELPLTDTITSPTSDDATPLSELTPPATGSDVHLVTPESGTGNK